jgi:hypothetical protein
VGIAAKRKTGGLLFWLLTIRAYMLPLLWYGTVYAVCISIVLNDNLPYLPRHSQGVDSHHSRDVSDGCTILGSTMLEYPTSS